MNRTSSLVALTHEELTLVDGGSFRQAWRADDPSCPAVIVGGFVGALLGPVGALIGVAVGQSFCESPPPPASLCEGVSAGGNAGGKGLDRGLCFLDGE